MEKNLTDHREKVNGRKERLKWRGDTETKRLWVGEKPVNILIIFALVYC